MANKTTILEEFAELVDKHDLQYVYSDDHSVYTNGQAEYRKIFSLAKQIPENEARAIWNAAVDRKVKESQRHNYYWYPRD